MGFADSKRISSFILQQEAASCAPSPRIRREAALRFTSTRPSAHFMCRAAFCLQKGSDDRLREADLCFRGCRCASIRERSSFKDGLILFGFSVNMSRMRAGYFTCKHGPCCASPLQLVSTCKHCTASILHSAQVDRSIMLKAHLSDIFSPKMASRDGRSLSQAGIDRLIDWLMVPGDLSIHLSSKWATSAFPAQRKTTALSHKPRNENSPIYSAPHMHPRTSPPLNSICVFFSAGEMLHL